VWDRELQFLFYEADALCGLRSYTQGMIDMIHFGMYDPPEMHYDHVPRLRRVTERFAQLKTRHQQILMSWYCRPRFEPLRRDVVAAHKAFERTRTSQDKDMPREYVGREEKFDPRAARLHLANMMRADQKTKRDLKDPSFSLDELARMAGMTHSTMNLALQKAKVRGVSLKYPHQPCVPLSRLMELAKEFGWSKFKAKPVKKKREEE
jgi:hypothetical protein